MSPGPRIAVCVKWVDTRPEVDPLTGQVHTDPRTHGASEADRSAVEVALQVAAAWGGTVEILCAGPAGADAMLRDLGASGAALLRRIDLDPALDSARVGAALAAAVAGTELVVCGDHSLDRGSGAVPAFIAHHLGAAQSLGLTSFELPTVDGNERTVRGTRRLGFGRSEVVEVASPAVISVEGSVASLRRASLAAVLAAERRTVEVVASGSSATRGAEEIGPLRPPTRVVRAPAGADARDRILQLTGALVDHTPPRTIEVSPDEAAAAIIEQLRTWGHLE